MAEKMDEFTTKFVGNMYNQMTSDDSNVDPKGPLPKNKAIRNIKVNSFYKVLGKEKCFEEADGQFELTEIDELGNTCYHILAHNNSFLGVFISMHNQCLRR